jgi:hypothetical protein
LEVTSKAAKFLFASDLPERLKVYLTIFSNLDRSATDRSETGGFEVHARGKKDFVYGYDIVPFRRFPDIRSFKIQLKGID